MEGMALENPADGEPRAAQHSVLGDRADRVLRARRDESAPPREQRRDEPSVEEDRSNGELAEHASILAFRPPLDNWQPKGYTAN